METEFNPSPNIKLEKRINKPVLECRSCLIVTPATISFQEVEALPKKVIARITTNNTVITIRIHQLLEVFISLHQYLCILCHVSIVYIIISHTVA